MEQLKKKYCDRIVNQLNLLLKQKFGKGFDNINDMEIYANTLKEVPIIVNTIDKEFRYELNSDKFNHINDAAIKKCNEDFKKESQEFILKFTKEFHAIKNSVS
jgi:hypothetical protein